MADESNWEQVSALFEEALDQPAERRSEWLASSCADAEIREEVGRLLAAHERAEGVLERSKTAAGAPLTVGIEIAKGGKIGPYELIGEVGRGGMGVVYLAHDPRLQRKVALKFLPGKLRSDPVAEQRFFIEARAASALDHANICTIYDIGETDDDRLYLAMAYYEGETAAQMLAAEPLELNLALDIALQAARGLACAHEAGIIHRDIKPGNLFVTKSQSVKILDFGIAKLGDSEDPSARIGTVVYMSPEQLLGQEVSAATDLWALGVSLYEMLSGRRPFHAEHESVLFYDIVHEPHRPLVELRTDLPLPVSDLVDRLLAKRPADRVASAGRLIDELEALTEPRRGSHAAPIRVPTPLNSFIGRDTEMDEIQRSLAAGRLLTLTGPGGAGKTRLAIEMGRRQGEGFPDGALFVPLAAVREPRLLAAAIASELGVPETAAMDAFERLREALAGKRLLLILDNFEQVLEGAPIVAELLAELPHLKILVTSRGPLRLSGEREYPVNPLPLPQTSSLDADALSRNPSVALFVERAQAAKPDFKLTPKNAAAVAAICERLDGLPLAIELAAVRIRMFSPEGLLVKLRRRLDVLRGGIRDLPGRHQALREAIEWSYELLTPQQQCVFQSLAVFSGGASLEAIETVCREQVEDEDVADIAAALIDQSLVRRAENPTGEVRLGMLETIREFALERLAAAGNLERAEQRHLDWFLSLAENAEPQLTGVDQAAWLDRLDEEHDNLRAALDRSMAARDAEQALRLVAALWRFWVSRGHIGEGRRRVDELLALPLEGADPGLRARALHGVATLVHYRGENVRAKTLFAECLALWRSAGDASGLATALNSLAWLNCELSRYPAARSLSEEALAQHTELGDARGQAVALNNLGWTASFQGDFAAAHSYFGRSLELRRKAADTRGIALAAINLAWAERELGREEPALALIEEGEAILGDVGDDVIAGWALVNRATLLQNNSEAGQAEDLLLRALDNWQRSGHRSTIGWIHLLLGRGSRMAGDLRLAGERAREGLAIWRETSSLWGTAWGLYELACVATAEGRHRDALAMLRESLSIRMDIGDQLGLAQCAEALAALRSDLIGSPRAATILAAASSLRGRLHSPLPGVQRPWFLEQVGRLRQELGKDFNGTWREGERTALEYVLRDL